MTHGKKWKQPLLRDDTGAYVLGKSVLVGTACGLAELPVGDTYAPWTAHVGPRVECVECIRAVDWEPRV